MRVRPWCWAGLSLSLCLACSPAPNDARDAGVAPSDAARALGDAGPRDSGRAGDDGGMASGEQLPPMGAAAIEAWLGEGHYLSWRCEGEAHAARPPGAHGVNRICTNDAMSDAPPGPFPVGAASVKEIVRDGEIIGWAVSRKLDAESAGGAGWYWYERIGTSTYADGRGAPICTGCHVGAGPDFAPTARDFVFTVVP